MMVIRQAEAKDVSRIAEILVFSNRVNFYPIFKDDEYSFDELQVVRIAEEYAGNPEKLGNTLVYDDGVIRGMINMNGDEICKLFVDPFFTGRGYGAALLEYAVENFGVKWLWALEVNEGAVRFYQRHGFVLTDEKVLEEGTDKYLVKMVLRKEA